MTTLLVLGAFSIFPSSGITSVKEVGMKLTSSMDEDLYAMCIIMHPRSSSAIKSMELVFPPEFRLRVEESVGHVIRVYASDGSLIILNNEIEMLNFMSRNGWEFKDVYTYTANSLNMIKYIFVRKST